MELVNKILIVQKKIIEDYTDIKSVGSQTYMVIRNKPIESQLDSYIKYALDGDPTTQKSFHKAGEDFLNNSIYGFIAGHNIDGDYIIKIVDDTMEDKSIFDIKEEELPVKIETSEGVVHGVAYSYTMRLK